MRKEPSARIYRNAQEFYNLAAPAFEDNAILEASPNAVVCNLALCVELLLKCTDSGVKALPHKEGVPLANAEIFSNLKGGGHDLAKMFERMDGQLAAQLGTLYQECTGENLGAALTKCKDYFTHARYAYESNHAHSYDISAIKRLADGLIAALLKGWGPRQPG